MAVKLPARLNINVHHLTRVEGHGNIVVNLKDGILEECHLEIVEAPRFFEAMLVGKSCFAAPEMASRICGICSVTHSTASIRAVENALGIQVTEQTQLLRQLLLLGEFVDSHILHIYMLAAPDFVGAPSAIALASSKPEVVLRALKIKKLAGDLCAVVGGRHTHPVSLAVGGFTALPDVNDLALLKQRCVDIRPELDATVDLFKTFEIPKFDRPTENVALFSEGSYCLIDGEIKSSHGGPWPLEEYRSVTNEHLVTHSTAKHTRNLQETYMVGALSRYKINHTYLHPRAVKTASALGLDPDCQNPYMITAAQLVETVHAVEEIIRLIDIVLDKGITPEQPVQPARLSGEGVGAVEAPRGVLFHNYAIKDGNIESANCIIPTGQNLANIDLDLQHLVPKLLDKPQEEIRLNLEMLVRAYDPCISCSTHYVEVKFV